VLASAADDDCVGASRWEQRGETQRLTGIDAGAGKLHELMGK